MLTRSGRSTRHGWTGRPPPAASPLPGTLATKSHGTRSWTNRALPTRRRPASRPRLRLLNDLEPQPPPAQAGQPDQAGRLAQLAELLRRLNLSLTPIAQGSFDHADAEGHYSPSRKLRHLVRARSATCDAPGCQNPATSVDLDHTVAWPHGPTNQSNLAPRCRTHHRAKQAPDWTVEQLAPGVTRWTMPSGRSHVTTPTRYDT